MAVGVGLKLVSWLHSMGYNDSVRREWEPILGPMFEVLWFGSIGSLIVFTIFHWALLANRKPNSK
jgi:hypothetical protein